jgi:hypothetical protein
MLMMKKSRIPNLRLLELTNADTNYIESDLIQADFSSNRRPRVLWVSPWMVIFSMQCASLIKICGQSVAKKKRYAILNDRLETFDRYCKSKKIVTFPEMQ